MLAHEYTPGNVFMYNYCLNHSDMTVLHLSSLSPAEIKQEYDRLRSQVIGVSHDWIEKGKTNED